jgi:molybdopterin synthase catalytic subunit
VRIALKFFAAARDVVGQRELVLVVPPAFRTSALLKQLVEDHPKLQPLMASIKVAVNREYVDGDHVLADGDEVALIPPVSGGRDLFEITERPLSIDALAAQVGQTTSGAIASFLGIVRGHSRGRDVDHLEYDAYREMAVGKMRQIGEEIRARWPVDRLAIAHRVGRLAVGEASVAIAVASPHRHEALQACAYAIERLKEIVPIWKKEVWSDGAEWIGTTVDEYRMRTQKSDATRQRSIDAPPPPIPKT